MNTAIKPLTASLILLGCFYLNQSYAADPRFTLRGLTGSTTYADVDALLPLSTRSNSLFYLDAQGKINQDREGFAGLGLGYRKLYGCNILGANLFGDYTHSEDGNTFWIASPSLEAISSCWDARINGYIPVNRDRKNQGHFFPSGDNTCGEHGNCEFVEFHGHQQFEHRFLRFEEVGNGLDAAYGRKLPFFNCMSVHAGVYYYNMRDANDVKGVAANVEIPINPNWAVVSDASYDNLEHGAVSVGLRFQLGHTQRQGCCPTLCDRLYDPIVRHIGPIKSGAGVPIENGTKDEGLFLRRDNIFFFSGSGTAVLGDSNAGTFENPFRDDQFNDATVAALGSGINFYFNTGTYEIDPLGNGRVTLAAAQSIYGRSDNFRCTAKCDERPTLEGGLDLTGPGLHVIDSIQLRNIQTRLEAGITGPVIGVSLDATQALFCNDIIHVEANVAGDNIAGENVAIAIVANDSLVTIDNSLLKAIALVGGSNNAIDAATGIGNYNANFSNNVFFISNSSINALARSLGDTAAAVDNAGTLATGIGTHAAGTTANFTNNNFSIVNTDITAQVNLGLSNTGSFGLASGIGNTAAGVGSLANFEDNTFLIACSEINSSIIVGVSNNSQIEASGIGNQLIAGDADFINNQFSLTGVIINAFTDVEAGVGVDPSVSFVVGIGNNGGAFGTADFTGNVFSIIDSTINAIAQLGGVNNRQSAIGIGNNAFIATTNFLNNNFAIVNTNITASALVDGDNNFSNFAIGIGNTGDASINDFSTNNFSITDSSINATALVTGSIIELEPGRIGSNIAIDIGTVANEFDATRFLNNNFFISSSTLNALARVAGDNFVNGINSATGIGSTSVDLVIVTVADFTDNQFKICDSTMNVSAQVGGDNLGQNLVRAIGTTQVEGSAVFARNSFDIDCSSFTASALVFGDNSGLNNVYGIRASEENNTIRFAESSLNILARVFGANTGTNSAIGLSALGTGSIIQTFNSLVNVTALANSEVNTAIGNEGNVVDNNTIYHVIEQP